MHSLFALVANTLTCIVEVCQSPTGHTELCLSGFVIQFDLVLDGTAGTPPPYFIPEDSVMAGTSTNFFPALPSLWSNVIISVIDCIIVILAVIPCAMLISLSSHKCLCTLPCLHLFCYLFFSLLGRQTLGFFSYIWVMIGVMQLL